MEGKGPHVEYDIERQIQQLDDKNDVIYKEMGQFDCWIKCVGHRGRMNIVHQEHEHLVPKTFLIHNMQDWSQ